MPVRSVRRRYLSFTTSSSSIDDKAVQKCINHSILELYGLKGLSHIDPNLIQYDKELQKGIIRCSNDGERFLRAAMAFVTRFDEDALAIRVWKSSGTIKSLRANLTLD
jgi:RNase P/RNase MRP subunit POP5